MRNGNWNRPGQALGATRDSQPASPREGLLHIAEVVIDGCLPALKKHLGMVIEVGQPWIERADNWLPESHQLVIGAELGGGTVLLGVPNVEAPAVDPGGTLVAGTGLRPMAALDQELRETLTGLFQPVVDGLSSVARDVFRVATLRAGLLARGEEPGTGRFVVIQVQAREQQTRQRGTLSLVLSHDLAEAVVESALTAENEETYGQGNGLSGRLDAGRVTYQRAYFQELEDNGERGEGGHLDLLMDVPLEVTVELGRARRQVREVLELGPGSVIELDKLAGEPVDIHINGSLIARGEVVVVWENFGVRITDIVSPSNRIGTLS